MMAVGAETVGAVGGAVTVATVVVVAATVGCVVGCAVARVCGGGCCPLAAVHVRFRRGGLRGVVVAAIS